MFVPPGGGWLWAGNRYLRVSGFVGRTPPDEPGSRDILSRTRHRDILPPSSKWEGDWTPVARRYHSYWKTTGFPIARPGFLRQIQSLEPLRGSLE